MSSSGEEEEARWQTDVVAGPQRGVGPHDEPGTSGVRRRGTHNAEILRAGAGAPRGLRRRDHNAEAERTHGERRSISETITGAPQGPPFPPIMF